MSTYHVPEAVLRAHRILVKTRPVLSPIDKLQPVCLRLGRPPATSCHPLTVTCIPQAFNTLFHRAIEQADKVEDTPGRISVLTESITHAVFLYTSQALFEKDKLTFLSQMAFQVRKSVTQKQPQNQSHASLFIMYCC